MASHPDNLEVFGVPLLTTSCAAALNHICLAKILSAPEPTTCFVVVKKAHFKRKEEKKGQHA